VSLGRDGTGSEPLTRDPTRSLSGCALNQEIILTMVCNALCQKSLSAAHIQITTWKYRKRIPQIPRWRTVSSIATIKGVQKTTGTGSDSWSVAFTCDLTRPDPAKIVDPVTRWPVTRRPGSNTVSRYSVCYTLLLAFSTFLYQSSFKPLLLQCFDTAGWATGRAPGLSKNLDQFPKILLRRPSGKPETGLAWSNPGKI